MRRFSASTTTLRRSCPPCASWSACMKSDTTRRPAFACALRSLTRARPMLFSASREARQPSWAPRGCRCHASTSLGAGVFGRRADPDRHPELHPVPLQPHWGRRSRCVLFEQTHRWHGNGPMLLLVLQARDPYTAEDSHPSVWNCGSESFRNYGSGT